MTVKTWAFQVEPEDSATRLDQLIAQKTGLGRRSAREILKLGGVQVDGKRVKVASRVLKAGQSLKISHDPHLKELVWEIPILYEDTWLLAVNKPAALPVQGTLVSDRHDLLALLKSSQGQIDLWIVHRLDAATSGVVLLAKEKEVAGELGRCFADHQVQKTYLAALSRSIEAQNVEAPIGRVRNSHPAIYGTQGDLETLRSAKTNFRPAREDEIQGLKSAHWAIVSPHTGRTHQIRVHAAHLGAPILGDHLYGGPSSEHLWLHAWKLALKHPSTGKELLIEAPPQRFKQD